MIGLHGRAARIQPRCRMQPPSFERLEERIALSGTPPTVADVAVAGTQWSPAYYAFINNNSLGTDGYSIPVGSTAQTTALPWRNIDQIRIRFSEDVKVQAADLALTGINGVSYAFSNFFYDPQIRTATWTLTAALTKDRILIDLDANGIDPVTDFAGNVIDGEWINNSDTFSSGGNGTAGGDFEFLLNVLPGEVNSTTQVTSPDYLYTRSQDGKTTTSTGYNFKYDIDGSGFIDSSDWQFVQGKMGNTLPAGSPAGTANDAPTGKQIASVGISNAAIDTAISLWANFGDNESSASGLTYSIANNTAASLFDYVSINSATGQLILNTKANVSGIAKVTIAATDAGGITTSSTISVGVNHANQAPTIYPFVEYLSVDTYRISGTVVDDEDPTGLIVELYNVFDARAVVYPDGTFLIFIELTEEAFGNEYLKVADWFGVWSEIAEVPIGN